MGCASREVKIPAVLSEAEQARITTIGVVSARFPPEVKLILPAKGALEGAGEGAKAGAAIGAAPGLEITAHGDASGARIGIPLAAAGAVVGAIMGTFYGVFAAEPAATIEEAETTLENAIVELKIREKLQQSLLQEAREKTDYSFLRITELGPTASDENVVYSHQGLGAIEAILETSVLSFGLTATSMGPNPQLAVFMMVRVRLIALDDDAEFYDEMLSFQTDSYEYTHWCDDDGQRFLAGIEEGYQKLSHQIVYELFLRH